MPHITVISGPCGCGKTTLARAYARRLGEKHPGSPVCLLHGDDFRQHFVPPENPGLPWPEILSFNWECLLATARAALSRGAHVVLDYVVETELPRVLALAGECSAQVDYIVLTAAEEALRARLTDRGDPQLAERAIVLKHELESLPENKRHLLDVTALPPEEALAALEEPGRWALPRLVLGSWETLEKPISALRTAVFIEEQDVPEEEVFDGTDGPALHAALLEGDTAVAAASVHENHPGVWQIKWVVTAKDRRGRGLGRIVMNALLAEAARRGGREVTLEGQLHAVPFYEQLGFREHLERITYPSGFVLVPMHRPL